MSESWNGIEIVKGSGERICSSEIIDTLTYIRAVPRDNVLHVNRTVYDALAKLYDDREPLFDIKTTGTVKDNVLYNNEVFIHEL